MVLPVMGVLPTEEPVTTLDSGTFRVRSFIWTQPRPSLSLPQTYTPSVHCAVMVTAVFAPRTALRSLSREWVL